MKSPRFPVVCVCRYLQSIRKNEPPRARRKDEKQSREPDEALRARLSAAGIKRKFLDETVLPSWWDESLALTPGGFREVVAYISANLCYSMKSLLDPSTHLEISRPVAVKYKKGKGISEDDVCLSTQIALGLARTVANAMKENPPFEGLPAPEEWRPRLLEKSDQQWICLRHILRFAWDAGISVVHLRNLPKDAKKPDALATMVGDRPVIVLLSKRKSPSWIAFTVAHELGHIRCGHLKPGQTLVDGNIDSQSDEKEEIEANAYAKTLLTGFSDLGLSPSSKLGPPQLVHMARDFGKKYRVAPGVTALNYAFTTGAWPVAIAALSILEKNDDASLDLSKAMLSNLAEDDTTEEAWEFISRTTDPEG